jgi:AcrR family transcriptional regulator
MRKTQKDVRGIIVKSAQEIFARFGFRKTTMDEIAQAAHKAKSSIYHYFASKEEIFKEIVEKEGNLFKKEITKAINREDTPQKKIRAYIITRMHTINQLANFYSAIKDEYLKQYGYIEQLRASNDKEEIRIMKKILNEGCEKGIYEIKDLDVTATTIITALKGMEYFWINEKDVSKAEKDIDNLLEILFNGIVKR